MNAGRAMRYHLRTFVLALVAYRVSAQQPSPQPPATMSAATGNVSYADLPAKAHSALNTNVAARAESAAPATPRQLFNTGTEQLRGGKLREAEASFESALASQRPSLQLVALYNLGHVRFNQGIEALKKGPPAKPAAARARNAGAQVNEAVRQADEALAGDDVPKMVAAYMRGRGARKEAKAATQAVRRALEAHGATLTKWQRAEGDFKG